jgi:hypothetical protein
MNEQDPDLLTPAFRRLKRVHCNHKKLGCDLEVEKFIINYNIQ